MSLAYLFRGKTTDLEHGQNGKRDSSASISFSCSLYWPRTEDENIHQSPGALLPVRSGCHIGNADQSPE